MIKHAFWNNKGGTGKTSLIFQCLIAIARDNPEKRFLALDLCPQANFSELLLGGLVGAGADHLRRHQNELPARTVGGYFEHRLPSPFSAPRNLDPTRFLTRPCETNPKMPPNIDLLCGDPLLELQSTAISSLANTNIPGHNSWMSVIDWLTDFLNDLEERYELGFIDCNPSFSMYTQIALSCCDRLVLPVMADDSSRRALENAFSLVYGFSLPSDIYEKHNFATRLKDAGRPLPKVHLILKNRLTQYMGPASAYAAVLNSIDLMLASLLRQHPSHFTFQQPAEASVDIRDFGTTGVVAFAQGHDFGTLKSGQHRIGNQEIQVRGDYVEHCLEAIRNVTTRLL